MPKTTKPKSINPRFPRPEFIEITKKDSSPSTLMLMAVESIIRDRIYALFDEEFYCPEFLRKIHQSPLEFSFSTNRLNYSKIISDLLISRIALTLQGETLPNKFIRIRVFSQEIQVNLVPYRHDVLYESALIASMTLEPFRVRPIRPKAFITFRSSLSFEKKFRELEFDILQKNLRTPRTNPPSNPQLPPGLVKFYENIQHICLKYDKHYSTALIYHSENVPEEAKTFGEKPNKDAFDYDPDQPDPAQPDLDQPDPTQQSLDFGLPTQREFPWPF